MSGPKDEPRWHVTAVRVVVAVVLMLVLSWLLLSWAGASPRECPYHPDDQPDCR